MTYTDSTGKPRVMEYDDFDKLSQMEVAAYFKPFWRPLFLAFVHHHDKWMEVHKDQAVAAFDSFQKDLREKKIVDHSFFKFCYPPYFGTNKAETKLRRCRRNFFKLVHPTVVQVHMHLRVSKPGYDSPPFLDHDLKITRVHGMMGKVVREAPADLTWKNVHEYLATQPGFRDIPQIIIPGVVPAPIDPEKVVEVEELVTPERVEIDDKGDKIVIEAVKKKVQRKVSGYKKEEDFEDSELDKVPDEPLLEDEPINLTYDILMKLLTAETTTPSGKLDERSMKHLPGWITELSDEKKSSTSEDKLSLCFSVYSKMAMEGVFYFGDKLAVRKSATPVQVTRLVQVPLGEDKSLPEAFIDYVVRHFDLGVDDLKSITVKAPFFVEYIRPRMYVRDLVAVLKGSLRGHLKPKVPIKDKSETKPESSGASSLEISSKLYDDSDMIDFSEDMRLGDLKESKLSKLMSGFTLRKLLVEDWSFQCLNYGTSREGIITQVEYNGGDVTSKRDIIHAGVIQYLIEVGVLTGVNEGTVAYDLTNKDMKADDKKKFDSFSEFIYKNIPDWTCTVMIVALFAYCQGIEERNLTWFDSFSAVYGKFMTEGRMVGLCKAIHSCGTVSQLMDCITVGNLKSFNNVFTYRLTRLSTPSLVKTALKLVPKWLIMEEFDPIGLGMYRRFDEAGLLAHVSSGPLSCYCRGKVNPLKVKKIPNDLPISMLAPIEELPYHTDTIKKSKVILDAFKFDYGNWYQGSKAAQHVHISDVRFKALVEKVKEIIGEVKDIDSLKREDIEKKAQSIKKSQTAAVASVLDDWV